MKILKLQLVTPGIYIGGSMSSQIDSEGKGHAQGWAMTGTAPGVRCERAGVIEFVPWSQIIKATLDPSEAKEKTK